MTSAFTKTLDFPASGSIEFWDSKTTGLCLRAFAAGKATWSFRYRPRAGKSYERVTLGTLTDLTLADARARRPASIEVTDGGDPQLTRRQKKRAALNVFTFDRLAEQYLTEYAKPNKSSWKMDEMYLKRLEGSSATSRRRRSPDARSLPSWTGSRRPRL